MCVWIPSPLYDHFLSYFISSLGAWPWLSHPYLRPIPILIRENGRWRACLDVRSGVGTILYLRHIRLCHSWIFREKTQRQHSAYLPISLPVFEIRFFRIVRLVALRFFYVFTSTGYTLDITSFELVMSVMNIRAYSQRFTQGLSVINICVSLSRTVLTTIDRNATWSEHRFLR